MDSPEDIAAAMKILGPKRVETKEFNAEQFDPSSIQKLLQKSAPHPTFGNMVKVKVEPLNPEPCSHSCECKDNVRRGTCY